MRYMMLIYSTEVEMTTGVADELQRIAAAHRDLMAEARRRGVLVSADPLQETSTATTVRRQGGKVLTLDGPFAETKEQLAGYYILECADLDEAISWASRMPTACFGGEGSVEIRPLRDVPIKIPDQESERAQPVRG